MDDLGYGDINSFGSINYDTPNLNKLVNEGMLFTNFYTVQPVCSASRAALLTGCYSNRIGISGALMPYSKIGLNEKEITIAELLKKKGYATSIFFPCLLRNRIIPFSLSTSHPTTPSVVIGELKEY